LLISRILPLRSWNSGLSWALSPGSYWVVFEGTAGDPGWVQLPGRVPAPLKNSLFNQNGQGWSELSRVGSASRLTGLSSQRVSLHREPRSYFSSVYWSRGLRDSGDSDSLAVPQRPSDCRAAGSAFNPGCNAAGVRSRSPQNLHWVHVRAHCRASHPADRTRDLAADLCRRRQRQT
jgi:hypothetical protein